jgi:hypothetical protein
MTGQASDRDILDKEEPVSRQYDNVLKGNHSFNDYNIKGHQGSNNIYLSPIFATNRITDLSNDSQIKLWKSHKQAGITQSTNDSFDIPGPTKVLIPINIDKIDINPIELISYDDLAIPRLIRSYERQYIQHIRQNKGRYQNRYILNYKTNLFTNRFFYNISSKKLTKHDEHLLALGLKFIIDDHQTTETEFIIHMDEYHKRLYEKYDTTNMLRHTTEEPNPEIQRLKEYIKHLHLTVKDLYGKAVLGILTNETPQLDETIKYHDSNRHH